MRQIAAALAVFLALPVMATAQVRGMTTSSGRTAVGSVRATTSMSFRGSGSFGPSYRRTPVPVRPRYPRGPYWGGYYYGYAPYSGYSGYYGYPDYAYGWGDVNEPYTGYVGGTFDSSVVPDAGYAAPSSEPIYAYPPPAGAGAPVAAAPQPETSQTSSSYSQSGSAREEAVEPTVLVFRDGHRQEVANYAIVGSTLIVLSAPHSRIQLAELDIPATVRVNQDRGVDFRVPQKAQ